MMTTRSNKHTLAISEGAIRSARLGSSIFVPLNHITISWFHSLTFDSNVSPLLIALRENDRDVHALASSIRNVYETRQYHSANEFLFGRGSKEKLSVQEASSMFFRVTPWECRLEDLWHFWSQRLRGIRRENVLWGLESDVTLDDARGLLEHKAMVESKRLITLIKSIKADGFKVEENPIEAHLLTCPEATRILVKSGAHRVAVLSHLGLSHIPVTLTKRVDRSSAERWEGVQSGLYTIKQAEKIFNRMILAKKNEDADTEPPI